MQTNNYYYKTKKFEIFYENNLGAATNLNNRRDVLKSSKKCIKKSFLHEEFYNAAFYNETKDLIDEVKSNVKH